MNLPAKYATVKGGKKVRVGDTVLFQPDRPVIIKAIHRQGYDGTILTTSPSPKREYPHHFSGRASDAEKYDAKV